MTLSDHQPFGIPVNNISTARPLYCHIFRKLEADFAERICVWIACSSRAVNKMTPFCTPADKKKKKKTQSPLHSFRSSCSRSKRRRFGRLQAIHSQRNLVQFGSLHHKHQVIKAWNSISHYVNLRVLKLYGEQDNQTKGRRLIWCFTARQILAVMVMRRYFHPILKLLQKHAEAAVLWSLNQTM